MSGGQCNKPRNLWHVLIVDDSPSQLMGMKLIIGAWHETLTAEDGALAWKRPSGNARPDPDGRGDAEPQRIQATRSISKNAETAHIPIILMTTKDQ